MTRSNKLFLLVPLGVFILACQALAKPVSVSESLALTAAAVGTQAMQMASQSAPVTPGVVPTTFPGGGNIFDPQGAPVSVWKEIPVMPQAVAGEDVEGVYSYRVNASAQDVQKFYAEQLPGLGWTTVLSAPDLPFLVYGKADKELTITITDPDENGTIVLLAFQ